MKKKMFSSFEVKGSLKDQWSAALRDPGYWLLIGIFLILILVAVLR